MAGTSSGMCYDHLCPCTDALSLPIALSLEVVSLYEFGKLYAGTLGQWHDVHAAMIAPVIP
jgi:hypothetical protein